MAIDRETQQKIKDAANIVEVVGDYVKLTRRGANYMGLCPFHNERTPSFSVNPRRNFCHCFSCKKGGSPVNFIMEKEGIGYTEALLILAKKYGIPVVERELSDEERQRMSERESMIIAGEWAMNHFHDNLYNSEEGRDIGLAYLYSRGISDEAIRRYRLGYSIDRGDALIRAAEKAGYDIEVLKKIGLVGTSQQGRDYDKFRARVMFPIRNSSGKPIAFGGRALKGEPAKYINSPETLLYRKSNELYGIYEAKAEIIRMDRVFLMEGYLDVIGSWQCGLQNSVASSGTALTENQIALIHRFTNNVTLIYDGDGAGIKAAIRGIDMLLAQKLHVKVLLLPDGEDPDSFARKHTPEEFREYIESHQTDFIRFKIEALLRNAEGNPQEVAEAVKSVVTSIASIPDEIERISYIKECSNLMEIDERVIARQVAQALISRSGASRELAGQNFNSSVSLPDNSTQPPAGEEAPADSGRKEGAKSLRSLKLEEEILKYCIRYGYVRFSPEEDVLVSVIDYVKEEMDADGITLSDNGFSKILQILIDRGETFEREFENYRAEVEKILALSREQFQENLRLRGGSLAKIKVEEKKFAEEEEIRREELMKRFAIDYSVNHLINHEDDQVRRTATGLVAERHTLSSIYTRAGNRVLQEEERLAELVPRALSELRSEILNSRVRELQEKIVEAVRNNDLELQKQLMASLSKLLYARSKIAEDLGERIIVP